MQAKWQQKWHLERHLGFYSVSEGGATDPNAPSGASTAAPVLGVWCSCWSFGACKCYRIGVLVIWVFLAFDICIFLQLSTCSWRFPSFRFVPGGFGILQTLLQRSNQNPWTMMPKSIKIHPKIIPNPLKRCPGASRKATWKQAGSGMCARNQINTLFITTWAILGAILGPAGPQLGPKIEHFGIKIEKLAFQNAWEKNHAEKV